MLKEGGPYGRILAPLQSVAKLLLASLKPGLHIQSSLLVNAFANKK